MSYKCVNDLAPDNLIAYFTEKELIYNLRYNDFPIYNVPATHRKTYGDRAFSVAGPREWNKLPSDIKMSSTFSFL